MATMSSRVSSWILHSLTVNYHVDISPLLVRVWSVLMGVKLIELSPTPSIKPRGHPIKEYTLIYCSVHLYQLCVDYNKIIFAQMNFVVSIVSS